jgi:hypothetical protein
MNRTEDLTLMRCEFFRMLKDAGWRLCTSVPTMSGDFIRHHSAKLHSFTAAHGSFSRRPGQQ